MNNTFLNITNNTCALSDAPNATLNATANAEAATAFALNNAMLFSALAATTLTVGGVYARRVAKKAREAVQATPALEQAKESMVSLVESMASQATPALEQAKESMVSLVESVVSAVSAAPAPVAMPAGNTKFAAPKGPSARRYN